MKKIFLILSFFLLVPAFAAKNFDFNELRKMVVLDQGRLKPLESFSDAFLLELSGKKKTENYNSVEFLGYLLFDSEKLNSEKVFLINNPQVLEALELKPESHRRYSFSYLMPKFDEINSLAFDAFSIDEENRALIDRDFMDLFSKMHAYLQLSSSLDLIESVALISASKDTLNEEAFMTSAFNIFQRIKQNEDYKKLFSSQKSLAMIPELKENSSGVIFRDAWDYFGNSLEKLLSSPFSKKLINIFLAYKNNDQEIFNNELKAFNLEVKSFMKANSEKYPKLSLELSYNKLKNFFYSKLFYLLTFISSLLIFRFGFIANLLTKTFLALAFSLHSLGLALRMLILERAPVSNLYESFIFVSWFMVFLALIFYFLEKLKSLSENFQERGLRAPKDAIGTLTNSGILIPTLSLGAFILLMISGKFTDGDTMQVLIAVLDSNFWLSTHVICISIGYSGVALAGLLAHWELINKNHANSLLMPVLAFSLCFTFLGTMLGGIWADQSWGRFWGWDPKENGALLIVLWIVLTMHMKLAGMLRERGIAIMSVIGLMVLMLSWFGVNLLGVGLHSYGFSSGFAISLGIYFLFEIGFLICFSRGTKKIF